MTRLTINGLNYNVEIQGSGVPLVLLHGFTGSVGNWAGLAGQLARNFTVIRVDLPGHGRSDAPDDPARYSMPLVAADLAKLFQVLTASPVNLLGYSMGGRLALYVALHYPDLLRSLVLESASPGLDDAQARQERCTRDNALADRIEREGIPAFVDFWEDIPLFASQQRLPQSVRAALRAQRLQNRPHGLANSLRGMGTGVQPSLWPSLDRLRVPTLLLAGEQDPKFTRIAEQMAARMPDARRVIVPDTGHTLHLEHPDFFRPSVHVFIHSVLMALFEEPEGKKAQWSSPYSMLAAVAR